MIKEIVASGKTITEAQENARAALGVGPLDEVEVKFEIIHAGSKGIFGIIGVKPAQVKAYIEIPDNGEERAKKQRPRREKNEARTDIEASQKPKSEKNRRKKNKKKSGDKKTPATPESELKMTRREVNDGEDCSFDFVKTVLSDIGLNAEAELYGLEDGTRRIIIVGDDASALIGHHGDTLDALQYLANLASQRKNINGERDKSRVTIDIEGYRAKREDTLRRLARRMAQKALKNRRSVMLEPMSAYERRIIHSEVQKIDGVSTNSVGTDTNRKIVIYLIDKKPEELFEAGDPVGEDFIKDESDLTDSIGAYEQVLASEAEENEVVACEITEPDSDDESISFDEEIQ
jgi:spoIIIJ-associated protein